MLKYVYVDTVKFPREGVFVSENKTSYRARKLTSRMNFTLHDKITPCETSLAITLTFKLIDKVIDAKKLVAAH